MSADTSSEVLDMDARYVIPDFKVEDQDLTMDDVRTLLMKEVITVFSLVKRTTEEVALPIVSHPDFEGQLLDSTVVTSPSIRVVKLLEKVRESRSSSRSASSSQRTLEMENFSGVVSAIVSQGAVTFSGEMVERSSEAVLVRIASTGIQVGRSARIILMSSRTLEKYEGLVKTFSEATDPSRPGKMVFVFEISLVAGF